ncbi:MAG: LCP family protein [Patescibacteria group bacterium]|nr:LCP family protein [Patescibacteria group bacterium]
MAGLGWFGWISYNSIKNIFGNDKSAPGLLGFLDKKQLKGESSGRVNILILGVGDDGHAGATLSDTIMVMSYDVKSKNVAMLSIPRDLYVKISDNCGYAKINYAHACGEEKNKGSGPELAEKTVSNILDIPIHYYIRADFTGFKKMIDAVGGVDIYVDKDLYDPLYPDGTFYITQGQHHMDGTTALKYARSRETTSDFDRAKRQQQVLSALKDKILSSQTLFNPKKMADIIGIIGEHVKTDFRTDEFQRVLELAKQVDTKRIINKVFDNGADGLLINGAGITPLSAGSTLIPKAGLGNYSELRAAAKNIFNDTSIKTESAKIVVYNGTTKAGLATTVANNLKASGYNVVDVGSAATTAQAQTVIYDYTNGAKPTTVSSLEQLLKVKSVKKQGTPGYDIEIIIGLDYKG